MQKSSTGDQQSWRVLFRPVGLVLAVSGLLFIVSWGLTVWEGLASQQELLAARQAGLAGLCREVKEQTHNLFTSVRLTLVAVDHWVATHQGEDPRFSPEFAELVDAFREVSAKEIDIRLVTADGGLFYVPSKSPVPLSKVSDREYFAAQNDPATRGFHLAAPVLSRVTGIWGIPISYPLHANPAGVAVAYAALEMPRLNAVLESSQPTDGGAITLVRSDGQVLDRVPFDSSNINKPMASTLARLRGSQEVTHGVVTSDISPFDGQERLVAWDYDPEFHFYAIVSAVRKLVLAPWLTSFLYRLEMLAAFTVLVLLLDFRIIVLLNSEVRIKRELEHQVMTDALTGLNNRRSFLQQGQWEVTSAIRHRRLLCVAMLDLDHFKQINDSFGHATGDLVLKAFAGVLGVSTRITDLVGRLGGEEFAVLMPETDLPRAAQVAERIAQATRGVKADFGRFTVSVGLTEWDGKETLDSVLSRADQALYRAKELGRDRVEVVAAPGAEGGVR